MGLRGTCWSTTGARDGQSESGYRSCGEVVRASGVAMQRQLRGSSGLRSDAPCASSASAEAPGAAAASSLAPAALASVSAAAAATGAAADGEPAGTSGASPAGPASAAGTDGGMGTEGWSAQLTQGKASLDSPVTSRLQIGQTLRMRTSQSSILRAACQLSGAVRWSSCRTHSLRWKMCPHGSTRTRSPSTKSERQMAHSSQLRQGRGWSALGTCATCSDTHL
jgi:hypothetical protein